MTDTPKSSNVTHLLALRGKNAEELRTLATKYLKVDAMGTSTRDLTKQLSVAASKNSTLSRELGESPLSLKPSFYLMTTTFRNQSDDTGTKARRYAAVLFDTINSKLNEDDNPALKEFQVVTVQSSSNVIEVHLTWHQIMNFWSTKGLLDHVYALKVGFVFMDLVSNKALICCHTLSERDLITEALERHLDMQFTPITLTKKLLENIGTFDKVKRANYLVSKPNASETEEVSYADPQLSNKVTVVAQEESPKYFRKQSFYRVDLGGSTEVGVGVTSDTAKLWIPSETAIETVRDYGLLLLKKFTTTLRKMKQDGDIPGILKILTVQGSRALSGITNAELRADVGSLIHELVQMILKGEAERSYTPPAVFLTHAIPKWFNPARMRMEDETTGAMSFWSEPDGQQFVSFTSKNGKWEATTYSGGRRKIDLRALPHPLSGNKTNIDNPPRVVELWPTPWLHEVVLLAVKQIASELTKLRTVVAVPFHIDSGRLVVDLPSTTSQAFADSLKGEIDANHIQQFSPALQHRLTVAAGERLLKQLNQLKEKCVHMTDRNCEMCLEQRRFICLRSLLARFLTTPQLLMHKPIELSDLTGAITVDDRKERILVFSKIAEGRTGLTLRNSNGAILLAQVVAQLDKTTFDLVGILSPSVINEDLRERLIFLTALVKKKVLIVNGPLLAKMLAHFEEQTKFERKDPKRVYRASRSKKSKGFELEATGTFV